MKVVIQLLREPSNQIIVVKHAAARAVAWFECHLILGGVRAKVFDGNLLLSYLLGAKIHFSGENRKEKILKRLNLNWSQKEKNVL